MKTKRAAQFDTTKQRVGINQLHNVVGLNETTLLWVPHSSFGAKQWYHNNNVSSGTANVFLVFFKYCRELLFFVQIFTLLIQRAEPFLAT